ncbi:type IV secretion system protein VirB3 [Succinivibrio dextrinosolvens]|uniref:VirB3 family type IV secretion system protein n=1 Tax=Succinivibrio dextrinosolvens TaxID=83771 RepID=UPI0008E6C2F7|nr:VirB3 family type IV secretion system protein [Succinivibrio dextrinosolvens]SFS48863.1 type IV secretion system protein VirB3 [Succinivibrio dextrinosolvens]
MNKKHQLYPSLLRTHTIFGAERTLFLLWLMLCMLGFILNISLLGSIETLLMLGLGWAVIARMSRIDPLFRQVYVRNIRYRSFYQAQGSEYSKYHSKYNR